LVICACNLTKNKVFALNHSSVLRFMAAVAQVEFLNSHSRQVAFH